MSNVHIFAVLYPFPDKVNQVRAILKSQCATVHLKEDYALRFVLTEHLDTETPEFGLFETYTSKESTDKHLSEPHFKEMLKTLQDQNLMAKSPYVLRTKTIAGFELDRNLIPDQKL